MLGWLVNPLVDTVFAGVGGMRQIYFLIARYLTQYLMNLSELMACFSALEAFQTPVLGASSVLILPFLLDEFL